MECRRDVEEGLGQNLNTGVCFGCVNGSVNPSSGSFFGEGSIEGSSMVGFSPEGFCSVVGEEVDVGRVWAR